MPVLRNVESMNYADVEKAIWAVGEKVGSLSLPLVKYREH